MVGPSISQGGQNKIQGEKSDWAQSRPSQHQQSCYRSEKVWRHSFKTQPLLLTYRNGMTHLRGWHCRWKGNEQIRALSTMESKWWRKSKKEKNILVCARRLSKPQWAELAQRYGRQGGRRREGLILARSGDRAQLICSPSCWGGKGKAKRREEALPQGWGSRKAQEGGG